MSAYLKVAGRKNYPTYTFNGKYIYSVYDPIREACQLIDKNAKHDPKVAITVCGADFVNKQLLDRGYRTIISIDLGMLLSGENDFAPEIDSPKIKRVSSIKQATDILLNLNIGAEDFDLLVWSAYLTTHSESSNILKQIKDMCLLATVNKSTAENFGRLETRNIKRNLATLKNIPILKKKCGNMLAVIVASGASLPRYLSQLKSLVGKSLIVSLPSAMKYLTAENIRPDYCIVVDPGYASLYHLNVLSDETKLICPLSINPAILRLPFVNPIFFDYGHSETKWIFNSDSVRSVSEGSVCFNALRVVSQLGCSKALLLGQDFAFCDHRSHVRGGFFETEYYGQTNYFDSIDKILAKIQLRKDPCKLDILGKTFDSDVSLKIYYDHLIRTDFGIEIVLPENVFNPISEKFAKI